MQITVADAVHIYLAPCLADILIGFGLGAMLEFSRVSVEMKYFTLIAVLVLLVLGVLPLLLSCQKIPPWIAICNTTYSLVLTLALSLNLLSQLCPPSGKELSLIPAYALLCVPRMPPSGKALLLLAVGSVLLLGAFLVLPTSRHVRPTGDVGNGWTLALSLLAGGVLQTFPSFGSRDDCFVGARLYRAGSVVTKGLLLVLLGTAQNTSFFHFLHDRENTVPKELFIAYGTLLLFASMQTAAVWFEQLKQLLGCQSKWRLVVRIQHIIYAMIVAAAWLYPLQMHALRVLILTVLLCLNFGSLM